MPEAGEKLRQRAGAEVYLQRAEGQPGPVEVAGYLLIRIAGGFETGGDLDGFFQRQLGLDRRCVLRRRNLHVKLVPPALAPRQVAVLHQLVGRLLERFGIIALQPREQPLPVGTQALSGIQICDRERPPIGVTQDLRGGGQIAVQEHTAIRLVKLAQTKVRCHPRIWRAADDKVIFIVNGSGHGRSPCRWRGSFRNLQAARL